MRNTIIAIVIVAILLVASMFAVDSYYRSNSTVYYVTDTSVEGNVVTSTLYSYEDHSMIKYNNSISNMANTGISNTSYNKEVLDIGSRAYLRDSGVISTSLWPMPVIGLYIMLVVIMVVLILSVVVVMLY